MRSILVLLLLTVPLYAHNGAITAVVPVDGIVVDGDLSDWPEHVPWQPISIPSAGLRLFDADDFSGRFRLGSDADERLRIVAVEVQDESVMPDASGQGRAQMVRDGCEIHLDLDHTVAGNPPLIRHTLWGSEYFHMAAASTDSFENAVVRVRRTAGSHIYEWQVDQPQQKWWVWNDRHWVRDETGAVMRLAKETVGAIYSEAGEAHEERREKVAEHARKSETAGK